MDVFDEDLLSMWSAFNKNNVQYIMIGGFAVNMHGFARTTEDVDIWLNDTKVNRRNLRKAFSVLGYGDYELLETLDFVPGFTQFYVGNGLCLHILTSMKGLTESTFEECLDRAIMADLNGILVPFLHVSDLIKNKKATARPKDIIDVAELQKIAANNINNDK